MHVRKCTEEYGRGNKEEGHRRKKRNVETRKENTHENGKREPFHRECFYVTGTRFFLSTYGSSPRSHSLSLRSSHSLGSSLISLHVHSHIYSPLIGLFVPRLAVTSCGSFSITHSFSCSPPFCRISVSLISWYVLSYLLLRSCISRFGILRLRLRNEEREK